MFGPKVLQEFDSKFSGKLVVKKDIGSKYVTTGYLTQSGGLIQEIWRKTIKKVGKKNKNWLILGLATGTAARIIPQPARIVGVEIDPVMLDIGRKYFDLDAIPNLEIVNQDAQDYVLKTQEIFDFALVDLYLGDKCPDFLYTPKFLKKLRRAGQLVIVNHLFFDDIKRQNAQKLVDLVSTIFTDVKLHRVLTNLMIICSQNRYN